MEAAKADLKKKEKEAMNQKKTAEQAVFVAKKALTDVSFRITHITKRHPQEKIQRERERTWICVPRARFLHFPNSPLHKEEKDAHKLTQHTHTQKDPNVLHNLGWLKCQQAAFGPALMFFEQALADPAYMGRAKTLMAQGLCQVKAGMLTEAEGSFLKSYEYDAANPVTGYNLSRLLFQKSELNRAQFYIRRLNNTEFANAESLWLGIKVEKKMGNLQAVEQLASQLEKRFSQSPEAASYRKGTFDE